jgi:GMP synthase (glutamine-hydrolysing)
MNKVRIAVLSSVKPWLFSSFSNDERFSQAEKQKALMDEIDVWRSTLEIDYLIENTVFEVVNVLEWLPRKGEYDGYILWGSPSMVTEEASWMIDLKRFIHDEVNSWKHTIWFCFWHQILSVAFGWTVRNAHSRNIWRGKVFLNTMWQADKLFSQMNANFESIWSHKQYVSNPWEAEVLGYNWHTPNQIIRIWDNAWWCQFHPEFSKEFCSFLVKLMSADISREWLDVNKTLADLEAMKWNESSKIITLFVQNLLKNWS